MTRFIVLIVSMFFGGFLAQEVFTDIPRWGIALHAVILGVAAAILVPGDRP